jgi:hypothetical protein
MIPMLSRANIALNRVWRRVRRSRNWPYLALLVFIVMPLFLTFIGGGLATATTVFAALLTREHNAPERRRLRLETVIKSLESLPAETWNRHVARRPGTHQRQQAW